MDQSKINRKQQRAGFVRWIMGLVLLGLLVGVIFFWISGDRQPLPQRLYRRAQTATPGQAVRLYERLAEEEPAIKEYARLWAAEAVMPDLDALRTLQAVLDFRPQSPAAYEAQVVLARYYAGLEAPQAETAYRAALGLHDTVALRLELARYLEEQGDNEGAYAEYRQLLDYRQLPGKLADAFAGMRRTGSDPVIVAQDLLDATYATDAMETLRGVDDSEALPVKAQVLATLGQYDQAEITYQEWLEKMPEDTTAQLGLAQVLARLGQTDEALKLYEEIDTPDSRLARANLLAEKAPDKALDLYLDSPYPVAWWSATTMLEAQGRLTETLSLYERLAENETYLADDAAYRLYILAERVNDKKARAKGKALLAQLGLDWLALRAAGGELNLPLEPPLAPAGQDILEKVQALELLGRDDLAHLELVLAVRFRRAPEIDLALAEALAERGDVVEAQQIAETYIEDHGQAPLAFWQLSYPRPYSATVQTVAAEFGVDPLLIWAVMREESRYDPNALSIANARGLMQVIPSTQAWIAEELGEDIPPGEAYTPETSIRMGAWFLRFLLNHFEGDIDLVIPAYNAGAANVESWQADPLVSNRDDFIRWIGFGETRLYLKRVSLSYAVYQELYAQQ